MLLVQSANFALYNKLFVMQNPCSGKLIPGLCVCVNIDYIWAYYNSQPFQNQYLNSNLYIAKQHMTRQEVKRGSQLTVNQDDQGSEANPAVPLN